MSKTNELQDKHLTMANEDYLEAIYRISLSQNNALEVRSVDIADLLGVSKASVSKALNNLKDEGYIEQSRYGKVTLTDEGLGYAEDLWRCHQTLESFLVEELGINPETASHEACLMEHAISQDTRNKWAEYMEQRRADKHD